jgi:hypothetical protein
MCLTLERTNMNTVPEDNRSPALAAMVGIITMPNQYAQVVAMAVQSVNAQCVGLTQRIEK